MNRRDQSIGLLTNLRDRAASLRSFIGRQNRPATFVYGGDASQQAVDIFRGKWVSAFPAAFGVRAGDKALYDDARVRWWNDQQSVSGKDVLELGPMEAAHTGQLLSLGAAAVTAIESNTEAFLKCLVAKEVMGLKNARFLCADFVEYLEGNDQVYDICLASGVLYHMKEPLRLLEVICRRVRSLFLWTHYYDEEVIQQDRRQRHRFVRPVEVSHRGFICVARFRSYGPVVKTTRHLGGSAPYSLWLKREDILAALKHFGMTTLRVHEDHPGHPNGPALTLFACNSN